MYFFRISFPYQYQNTLPVKSGNLLRKKRGNPTKSRSKTYSYNKTDSIFICCLNPKLPWQPQKGCLDQSSPVPHPPSRVCYPLSAHQICIFGQDI